jgi:hypothetical protein
MSDTDSAFQQVVKRILGLERFEREHRAVPHTNRFGTMVSIYTTNAGQSFASASTDIVNFEDLVKDTFAMVTTGVAWKLTAPRDGYYHVDVQVMFAANTGWAITEKGQLYVYVDGVHVVTLDRKDNFVSGASNIYMQLGGSTIVYLTAGQYFDIRLVQTSGGAIALVALSEYNRISVALL